jgi:IS30 family transposase
MSHETIYRHIFADNAAGGNLHQQLRCQKKAQETKRYTSGPRDRRGQIDGRRPISERPAHIETRSQVGHWEGDTVIGAAHQQAVVTLVERAILERM